MSGVTDQLLYVRRASPGSSEHLVALHLALSAAPAATGEPARPVANLLASAARGCCSLDLVFGTYCAGRLVSAAVGAESPGATALVFFPTQASGDAESLAAQAALRAVREAAWDRSIRLLEALVPPGAAQAGHILQSAGFCYLTQLLYLIRRDPGGGASGRAARGLSWVTYAPGVADLFCQTLELSYAESLDCPELTGLRPTAEVLRGHQATGVFDPSLWWVARRGREPVGILLLSRVAAQPALEIVYLGVAPPARGTGVGDALLERAQAATGRVSARSLTLAVDHRNTPALRVYRRWGFARKAARAAWIASRPQA